MLAQLTMFPTDRRGVSVSADVSKVIDIIDRSGLDYKLGPMSTTLEGSWDKIMATINKARKMLLKTHSRLYISITIDDRITVGNRITTGSRITTGRRKVVKGRLEGKIVSIEKKLGRKVRR